MGGIMGQPKHYKSSLLDTLNLWSTTESFDTLSEKRGLSLSEPPRLKLFDNLPELLKPEAVASLLSLSVKTIYDWHYRCKLKKVPDHLFLKFNRLLYLRRDVLQTWLVAQNPTLVGVKDQNHVS
jgi:hypothetical protein